MLTSVARPASASSEIEATLGCSGGAARACSCSPTAYTRATITALPHTLLLFKFPAWATSVPSLTTISLSSNRVSIINHKSIESGQCLMRYL